MEKKTENLENFKKAIISTIKSIVGDQNINIIFGSDVTKKNISTVKLPNIQSMGNKDDYIKTTAKELIDSSPAKKLDQPYLVIRIEKARSSASTFNLSGHNVTEVYLMSGIDEDKPKYLVLNLTTVSGSRFSMKAEVEREVSKSWV